MHLSLLLWCKPETKRSTRYIRLRHNLVELRRRGYFPGIHLLVKCLDITRLVISVIFINFLWGRSAWDVGSCIIIHNQLLGCLVQTRFIRCTWLSFIFMFLCPLAIPLFFLCLFWFYLCGKSISPGLIATVNIRRSLLFTQLMLLITTSFSLLHRTFDGLLFWKHLLHA